MKLSELENFLKTPAVETEEYTAFKLKFEKLTQPELLSLAKEVDEMKDVTSVGWVNIDSPFTWRKIRGKAIDQIAMHPNSDLAVKLMLLDNPFANSSNVAHLIKSGEVAEDTAASINVTNLFYLAQEAQTLDMLYVIKSHKNTNDVVLKGIMENSFQMTASEIQADAGLTQPKLLFLAQRTKAPEVLAAILKHPNCDPQMLTRMKDDNNTKNLILAVEGGQDLQLASAVPFADLEILMFIQNRNQNDTKIQLSLAERAVAFLDSPADNNASADIDEEKRTLTLRTNALEILKRIIENPDVDEDVLLCIADSVPASTLHPYIAKHKNASSLALKLIEPYSEDDATLESLARHPNADEELLTAIKQNKYANAATLQFISENLKTQKIRP